MNKTGKIIKCDYCGKEKYFPGWRLEREYKNRFCSMGCYAKYMTGMVKKKNIKVKCRICGKEFNVSAAQLKNGRGKTCSKECAKKSTSLTLTGRKNPEHSERMKGKKTNDKTKDKMSKSHIKYWDRRGRSKHNRPYTHVRTAKYRDWRIGVFERDNYTCQECGIKGNQKGGYLEAHHIKHWSMYKEERFNVDNGITLCKDCHIKRHKLIKLNKKFNN